MEQSNTKQVEMSGEQVSFVIRDGVKALWTRASALIWERYALEFDKYERMPTWAYPCF